MTGRLFGALSTMLGLVGLYLILSMGGKTTAIARTLGNQLRAVFKVLQGRG